MGCVCKCWKKILFTTHLITNFSLCAKHRKGTVLRSGAEQVPPGQPQPQQPQQPLYHQPPVQPPPPQGENLCQFYYFYTSNLITKKTKMCQNLTDMTYLQFFLTTMLLHNLKVF